jgi:hypothetical protein
MVMCQITLLTCHSSPSFAYVLIKTDHCPKLIAATAAAAGYPLCPGALKDQS